MMFKRFLALVVLIPVALLLIAFIVANREVITLEFNPFAGENSNWQVRAPVFLFLFAALGMGVVLGSIATWISQRQYRKTARREVSRYKMQPDVANSTHLAPLRENDGR